MHRLLVAALLSVLLAPVAAQDTVVRDGPDLVVILHHPDDGVDPLGVPWQGSDTYAGRYHHLVRDDGRFDFPHVVVDGIVAFEGLPSATGTTPLDATRDAYEEAFLARNASSPPAVIELGAAFDDAGAALSVMGQVTPTADLAGERLRIWVAAVEDHVFYEPPPAASNGITDHRFTVRALTDVGPLDAASGETATPFRVLFPVADGWDSDRLFAAVWVQQGASHGLRFDAHEVVQATIHHVVTGGVTRQVDKGVLLEMYSATWCEPCAVGDVAAERLAIKHGVASAADDDAGWRYFRAPAVPWLVLGAAIAVGITMAWMRLPGERS